MQTMFEESKTKENLMRAFAGESMARNRYTYAASLAKKNKFHIIETVFTFTANQEKEHGEIFYNMLLEKAAPSVMISADYPVDMKTDMLSILKEAQQHEYKENGQIYPEFGRIAQEEGFDTAANVFNGIASIEKTHGDRFGNLAALIEQGKLFVSDVEEDWICLNCGNIYKGTEAPKVCPVCNHNQGYFIRASFTFAS